MEYGMGGLPAVADPELFSRQNAGDDSLFVVFYMGILRNDAKSTAEGRPIFDDVEFARIMAPGDRNNVIDRPATAEDRRRFSKQYALFKEGKKEDDQISGTRLTDWPMLSRAQCEEFRYLGLRTVEQLAEVRDDILTRVPGMHNLKQVAKVWLGKAKNTAEAALQAKEAADKDARIQTLESALRDLSERFERVTSQARA